MPKKSKGGNSHKRRKNSTDPNEKLNMVYKEDGEEYAIVDKMLGGSRCQITLPDQSSKLAIIRGKLRGRRNWMSPGDLVLVSVRSFQDDKCDIIHKYTTGQIQMLKRKDSLPNGFLNRVNKSDTQEPTITEQIYNTVEFREGSDSEDELSNKPKTVKSNIYTLKEDNNDNTKEVDFEFDFDEI